MKLTRRGAKFTAVKRVPKRFCGVEPRRQVWIALGTDSPREAKVRAMAAIQDLERQWTIALQNPGTSIERYEALNEIASARGFAYAPAEEVARLTIDELLRRVAAAQESLPVAKAVLGGEPRPKHRLSSLADLYMGLVAVEIKDKSRDQRRIWENSLKRATGRLIKILGDKTVEDLNREDALAFRNHWVQRIHEEGVSANSANRELATISGLFSTLYKLKGLGNPDLFKNLAFSNPRNRRPPYEEAYIRDYILPALSRGELNQEAADICRILINTGMRPSEVTGLASEDINLECEVPHLCIRPRPGRELKTQTSIRDQPLVGIALEAAKRHPGGFARYADQSGALSQIVNKFLKTRNLRPTPNHSVYSFRHGFQDRLTAVEAPDRIQADLMGHRYVRERYGTGPSLAQKADWLSRIGFFLTGQMVRLGQ